MGNLANFKIDESAATQDLIPNGEYRAIIIESEECTTKRGDGSYIKLTFQITEGNQENRLIWVNLNMDNPNPKAVEIAGQELSNICMAAGIREIGDSSELHDIPLIIKVGVQKGNNGYDDQNRVKAYKKIGPSQTPATAAPSPAGDQPWKR